MEDNVMMWGEKQQGGGWRVMLMAGVCLSLDELHSVGKNKQINKIYLIIWSIFTASVMLHATCVKTSLAVT